MDFVRITTALGFFAFVANPVSARGILGQKAPSWGVTEWKNLPEGKKQLDLEDFKKLHVPNHHVERMVNEAKSKIRGQEQATQLANQNSKNLTSQLNIIGRENTRLKHENTRLTEEMDK